MTRGIKRTHDDFIEELNTVTNSILVLGTYQKNTLPIHCKCLICGHDWFPTPKSLLKGHGCPQCAGNIKKTPEEFLNRFRETHPHYSLIEVIGKYNGMSEKITCKCKLCGTIWHPKAGDLIKTKSGCPSCSGNNYFTHDRFIKELKSKNPNALKILLLSSYQGMRKRINCKCKECGHKWNPIASSLIQGSGCPICAKKRAAERGRELFKSIKPEPLSHDWFLSEIKENNIHAQTIEIKSEYKGARSQISCRCRACGHEWNTIASGLLHGSGCPNCSHTSTSFMEQFVYFAFCKVFGNDNVINRDTTAINKELDIFIPNEAFAVEIGSWNWHKDFVEKDLMKLQLCKTKKIRMIIVYDSCRNETITDDNIWTYPFDLRNEKNNKTLKSIVERCFQLMNKAVSLSDTDWNEITKNAYLASQRVNHDEFLKKLKMNNKHYEDIIVLSKYTYAKEKVVVFQLVCPKSADFRDAVQS